MKGILLYLGFGIGIYLVDAAVVTSPLLLVRGVTLPLPIGVSLPTDPI